MKQAGKFLIVLLALVTARIGLASSLGVVSTSATRISQCQSQSVVSKHKTETCPSHGIAMLILRYNENGKEYHAKVHTNGPVLQSISQVQSDKISAVTTQCFAAYFPEKLLQYEAYLYSLPLRSPPASC